VVVFGVRTIIENQGLQTCKECLVQRRVQQTSNEMWRDIRPIDGFVDFRK